MINQRLHVKINPAILETLTRSKKSKKNTRWSMFNFSMTHRNSIVISLSYVSSWCKYTDLSGEEKKKRKQGASASVLCNRVKAIRKERPSWNPGRNTSWKIVPCVHPSTGKNRRVTSIGHCWQLNCQPLGEETASWLIHHTCQMLSFLGRKQKRGKSTRGKPGKSRYSLTLIGVIRKFSWKQIISIEICILSILSH